MAMERRMRDPLNPDSQDEEADRGQTAFAANTLWAAGRLSAAGVGSVLTARFGNAWTSPCGRSQNPSPQDPTQFQNRLWGGGFGGQVRVSRKS